MSQTFNNSMEAFQDFGSPFLGVCLDALFYGFFASSFIAFVCINQVQGKKFYKGILNMAIVVLFTLSTTYFVIDITGSYLAFTGLHFIVSFNMNFVLDIINGLVDYIGQLTLIYRCWILWEKNYLVILLPTLLSTVSWSLNIVLTAMLAQPGLMAPPPRVKVIGTTGVAISVTVNTLVMMLLITKIWMVSREVKVLRREGDRTYRVVIAMLLETGATIMIAQLLYLLLFKLDSNGGFGVIASSVTQSYGINATILMIRVSMGISHDTSMVMGSSIVFQRSQFATRPAAPSDTQDFEDPQEKKAPGVGTQSSLGV